ncbi:cyclopropane fatty acyl phospholipid synthase [Leucothrix arctica]|nr:cyclopropane fatty acyl phospholipid synthase [Leucothrix arctica]
MASNLTMVDGYHGVIESLFNKAGITINGLQDLDITVHNEQFYKRILSQASLGLGESYMDGWWDSRSIDQMVSNMFQADLDHEVKQNSKYWWHILQARLFNLQSSGRAYQVADVHYNLGNDLFMAMLDQRLCYSCGYWKGTNDLDIAQENKLDLLCRKLNLQRNDHVLEIGCGWGSFAQYAAEKYGARVTGITVSKEQVKLAKERCKGLEVDILLMDYRELEGQFDKVVSIGMFEHVGAKNYNKFFKVVKALLKDQGTFVLHSIGVDQKISVTDPWIDRYIFPNGKLPALEEIATTCEPYFVIDDVQNMGPDYDTTLMAWHERFENAWPKLSEQYDERFRRMWRFYLLTCAGAFRSGQLQLFQVVFKHRNQRRARYDAAR